MKIVVDSQVDIVVLNLPGGSKMCSIPLSCFSSEITAQSSYSI